MILESLQEERDAARRKLQEETRFREMEIEQRFRNDLIELVRTLSAPLLPEDSPGDNTSGSIEPSQDNTLTIGPSTSSIKEPPQPFPASIPADNRLAETRLDHGEGHDTGDMPSSQIFPEDLGITPSILDVPTGPYYQLRPDCGHCGCFPATGNYCCFCNGKNTCPFEHISSWT